MVHDPFLGTILAGTKIIENRKIETAATDGRVIIYNPDFFKDLKHEEQAAVFAHEATHIALLHPYRCYARNANPQLWNIAADYVVNDALKNCNKSFDLPDCGLKTENRFKDKSTEAIYDILSDECESLMEKIKKLVDSKKNEMEKSGSIVISIDDLLEPAKVDENGNTIPEINGIPTDVIQTIQAAQIVSQCSPADLVSKSTRALDSFLHPMLNWKTLLRMYCNDFKIEDYSWRYPNKRYEDDYLPSLCGETRPYMKKINVYIDVSGSISDKQLAIFLSELTYLFDDLCIEKMTIQSFSIGLSSKEVFTDSRNISSYEPDSNGGTEIMSVIEDINKNRALFSIIFTDGEFDNSPVLECRENIFWLINDNPGCSMPKGKTVHISSNDYI